MASLRIVLFSVLVFGGFAVLFAQVAVNSVPETIQGCYRNTTAYDRYKRQPMRIENLIAIIRKLEHKTSYNWDMRRIARTIVKRYQFDGMEFYPDKNPDFAYSQWPLEGIKSRIINEMIPTQDAFPDGSLDNDERCALHWMMSHSMNSTMRDDEEPDRYGRNRELLRAKRSAGAENSDSESEESEESESVHFSEVNPDGTIRRVRRAVDKRTTNRPVETGTVYTRWGTISAGRVIAGIAAGLGPQEMPVAYIPSSGTNGNNPNNYNPGNSGFGPNNPGNNPNPINPINPGNPNSNPNPGQGQSGTNGATWGNNFGRRRKRQSYGGLTLVNIKNLYAATLGGDIGQAAVMNAPWIKLVNVAPPAGVWNDTICPREFTLNALPNPNHDAAHDHDTWTYMTAAEIRGGIDGLVLGAKMKDWDRGTTGAGMRLSQVLEMYYSEDGVSGDTNYRSCDRYQLFQGSPEANELREQSKSFAYEFNRRTQKITISDDNTAAFLELVEKAYQKMLMYGASLSSIDGSCVRRPIPSSGGIEMQDRDKYAPIKTTVYAILDSSVTDIYDIRQQQRFLGQLAFELNVSPTGSRIGLVDGGGGLINIKPNDTDNAAIVACRILDQPQLLRNQEIVNALRSIKQDIERLKDIEKKSEYNIGVGRGIVILIFAQGKKIEENRRTEIRTLLDEFYNNHGNVHVIFASSIYSEADFNGLVINGESYDFIRIVTGQGQNMSDAAADFAKEFVKKSHGSLYYSRCDDKEFDQSQEHAQPYDIFVTPGTIQYYQISPDNFFSSVDLRFRFTSEYGKIRICISRYHRFPSSMSTDNVECKETTGNYEAPGGNSKDVEFAFVKPCNRKRQECGSIYLSVTTTTTSLSSAAQTDCSIYGCEKPGQVKLTWSHYGMRCGAIGLLVSGTGSMITAILSLLYVFKSF